MKQDIGGSLINNEFNILLVESTKRYGLISPYYLRRSLEVVRSVFEQWPRVFAARIDLRLADTYRGGDPDMPTCFQRDDPQVITRFIESHKSQYREEHRRNGKRGEPFLPMYIWVREQNTSEHPHYHLVLFFNKDLYAFLGDYTNPDANNVATRIQRAWCSALALPYPDYRHLAQIPRNHSYWFDRKSAAIHSPMYWKFLLRMTYLFKVKSKPIGDGLRNFGCSQTNR